MLQKVFKRSTALKAAAFAATAAVMTAVAGPAAALEQGNCLPYIEAVNQLRAEGQHSLVTAEKVVPGAANTSLIIFSSNDNGTRGYELGGDRRAGQALPAQLCVGAVLSNIRLNNAFSQTVPKSFLLENTLDASELPAVARQLNVGAWGHHNDSLLSGAKNGYYPVLQARVPSGAIITVQMNIGSAAGASATSYGNGLMVSTDVFRNVAYTPYALEAMRGPVRGVALRPKFEAKRCRRGTVGQQTLG